MEDKNAQSGVGLGVTPWPKRPIEVMPFSMMSASNLPLGTSSFQVWKRPFLTNHGDNGSSSGTKTYFQPSDANSPPASTGDDSNVKTQNPSPSSDGGVNSVAGENNSAKAETVNGAARFRWGRNLNPNMDPKKLKRIMSNRVSAQKSRMKKLQHVTDMERRVKALEAQIAVLSPQVALYKNQQHLLQLEQKSLNQQMSTFTNNKILRDAEIEENKTEVNRLRQLHLNQKQQQMHAQTILLNWETGMEQMANPNLNQCRMGEMVYVNSNQARNSGENIAQMNRLSQLNLTQQEEQPKRGQAWMPSWELALGEMVNPSLNQSGTEQKVNINSNQLGGIDTILNYNTLNPDARNCFA